MEGLRPPQFSGKKRGFLFVLIYFLITGATLNAQPAAVHKAVPDRIAAALPAKAWDKVRQTLERDGLDGALTAGPDAQTIRIQQKAGLQASGPDLEDYLGFSVAISGDTVVVGAARNNSLTGAAYIFERNAGGVENWGQVKKLIAGDAAAGDWFGDSVAVSGDTVVVGAYGKSSYASHAGAAYIFERNVGGSDNWGQVKKLTAGDAAALDDFGSSVAISGYTVVVGAWTKDSWTGAAYIFERDTGGDGNWGQVKKLTCGDTAACDRFGISVAISVDYVVVGAWGMNSFAGAAYIFERHLGGASNWGQVKKLTAGDAAAGDYFGYSVAISGDTVVVGAYGKSSYAGAAYIFERNVGGSKNWGQAKKLTAGDAAASDDFGQSVAISGDTVVVGAWRKNVLIGAAYIFERNVGGVENWGQAKKLTAGDAAASDVFGISVAISGDTVMVGAGGKNSYAGAAYLFERNTGGLENWGEWGKFIVDDPSPGDQFGFSVAIHRDLALVGAPYRDFALGNNQGKACLFARNQGGRDRWSWTRTLFDPAPAVENHFGYSTALGEEFAFVGVPLQDNAKGQDAGAVRVYRRDQDGPNQWGYFKTLTAEDGAATDQLGFSLALDGDTLVAGALFKDLLAGAVYVFQRGQGGTDNWGQVRRLVAGDRAIFDFFGKAVAVSGNIVAVGAFGDDEGGESSGSVYLFDRDQGGANLWGQVKKLTAPDAGQDDLFGHAVGVWGDWVAVGAPKDDDRGADAGAVYLFKRNQGGQNLWGLVTKITVADGAPGDFFGTSLGINEQFLLVGAHLKNLAGEASGAAYLFRRDEGGTDNWGLSGRFQSGDPAAQDQFGISVALSGDTLLVGAAMKNIGAREAGAAYIFQAYRALFMPLILKN
jgi:hypothetical protein